MTEAEWLACEDPEEMVRHLVGKASERKMRLFIVGCCRRMWQSLREPEDRRAVELAERFADGEEGVTAVENFRQGIDWTRPGAAKYAVYPNTAGAAQWVLVNVERSLVEEGASAAVKRALSQEGETAEEARQAGLRAYAEALGRVSRAERSTHSRLLRDIFGNPFRQVTVDPSWLAWQDGMVVKLAQAIYEERRFEDLPVLADALEEAGCQNADILAHCRVQGPHARGCWLVDSLLGKK